MKIKSIYSNKLALENVFCIFICKIFMNEFYNIIDRYYEIFTNLVNKFQIIYRNIYKFRGFNYKF